ncbi:hypothetical protein CKY28_02115 [Sphingomonas lenta]|uniref:Uncharacterized protein n=1 Tax=Sphingomonas lenta TaxID=1141887 RepID=A0A2A2SKM4_9SPHN|nr:hypothetical protein CKY28_02115 [Sphingomonas lenta]
MALVPTPALADTSGLAAYLRARVADSRGEVDRAAADYARALTQASDPAVAIRAYREALAAGDLQLAARALAILDKAGVAPEDATLLTAARAARAGDTAAVEAAAAKLGAGRLVILAPVVRAWVAQSRGQDPMPVLESATDPVARRLATEARVLLLIAAGRADEGLQQLQSLGGASAAMDVRIAAAQLLGGAGKPELARRLFPADQSGIADALARAPVKPSPGFGVSRLFARVASDLVGGDEPNLLSITLTRAALVADPSNDRARLLLANALAKAGATDRALAVLGEIGNDSPFGSAAASARITVLTGANRRAEALADARRLAERGDSGRNDWQLYGDLLSASDRPAEAVPFYRRIAEGEGRGEWDAWMQLGGALELAGDWPAARDALARAVQLAPDEPLALNYLGYARITRGEAREASTRLLERAHQLAPENTSITDSLGWAYHLTGDTRRALPLLERAAEGEPGNAEIAEHLGDAYWALGRRYEARYAWRAAAVVADAKDKARLSEKAVTGLP